jgi:hypothetical protein
MTQAVRLRRGAREVPQAWIDPRHAKIGAQILSADVSHPLVQPGGLWQVIDVYPVFREVVVEKTGVFIRFSFPWEKS